MMRTFAIAATLTAIAACSPPTAQEHTASTAVVVPPLEPKRIPPPTDAWIGKWIGVEGNTLDIEAGAAPGVYAITEGTLDGEKKYIGIGKDLTIAFEDGGQAYTIRPGSGSETGLKYLFDKTNCLVI